MQRITLAALLALASVALAADSASSIFSTRPTNPALLIGKLPDGGMTPAVLNADGTISASGSSSSLVYIDGGQLQATQGGVWIVQIDAGTPIPVQGSVAVSGGAYVPDDAGTPLVNAAFQGQPHARWAMLDGGAGCHCYTRSDNARGFFAQNMSTIAEVYLNLDGGCPTDGMGDVLVPARASGVSGQPGQLSMPLGGQTQICALSSAAMGFDGGFSFTDFR